MGRKIRGSDPQEIKGDPYVEKPEKILEEITLSLHGDPGASGRINLQLFPLGEPKVPKGNN